MAVKASEYRKKVEHYREVYTRFVTLCADGKQTVSFKAFCEQEGVDPHHMSRVLKGEYVSIDKIPGYSRIRQGRLYQKIYDSFKKMCAEGKQPGTFSSYCIANGTTISQVHSYLKHLKLRVCELPGFSGPKWKTHPHPAPIPFENIIFEEAGFLPAGDANVITVSVDGHVAVRFPADTDIAVIAKFIKKMGKEVGHVES